MGCDVRKQNPWGSEGIPKLNVKNKRFFFFAVIFFFFSPRGTEINEVLKSSLELSVKAKRNTSEWSKTWWDKLSIQWRIVNYQQHSLLGSLCSLRQENKDRFTEMLGQHIHWQTIGFCGQNKEYLSGSLHSGLSWREASCTFFPLNPQPLPFHQPSPEVCRVGVPFQKGKVFFLNFSFLSQFISWSGKCKLEEMYISAAEMLQRV